MQNKCEWVGGEELDNALPLFINTAVSSLTSIGLTLDFWSPSYDENGVLRALVTPEEVP